ncbi:MAG: sulfurtransferase TusA family protein [Nitrospiraceae bacterium]|nr:sulfurtransferase TusA family protein [Nitrospiraceae bacterium]
MKDLKADLVIDVKGLRCPRPLLTAKQTLEKMQPGQTLEVISNDSSTKASFPPYLKRSGDELLRIETEGEEIRLFIRKK